jgi:hypothetical protein
MRSCSTVACTSTGVPSSMMVKVVIVGPPGGFVAPGNNADDG